MVTALSRAHTAKELPRLLAALERSNTVSVEGVAGSGKTYLLLQLQQHLERINERPVLVTSELEVSAASSEISAATHILVSEWQGIPATLLQLIQHALREGVTVVATRSVIENDPFLSVRDSSLGLERSAVLGPSVTGFAVPLHTNRELMQLVFDMDQKNLLSRLDAITLTQHSWGRPGWLRHLYKAAMSDSLFLENLQNGTQLHRTNTSSALMQLPGKEGCASLTRPEAAAAMVISRLDSQPIPSLVALFGVETVSALVRAGTLVSDPQSSANWGVPRIFIPVLSSHSTEGEVYKAGYETTEKLLTQSQLGLPLSASAEAFCESHLVLSLGAAVTPARELSPIQQLFMEQRFSSSIVFGSGETAKHILIQLGADAPNVCQSQRARLVALLQGSPAGLQSLFIESTPQANCSLPITDPATKAGLLGLRSQLAAETGQPFKLTSESPIEDTVWPHTMTVLEAWNTPFTEPLPPTLSSAAENTEVLPVLRLLSGLLTEIDHRVRGVNYNSGFSSEFSTDLTHQIGAYVERTPLPRQLDDLFLTAIIGNEILQVVAPTWPEQKRSVSNLTLLLAGGQQHQRWSTHLTRAKEHLLCGAVDLFFGEFREFQAQVPRFLPLRLQQIIAIIAGADSATASLALPPVISNMLHYFSGNFDAFLQKKLAPPSSSRPAQLGLVIPAEWHTLIGFGGHSHAQTATPYQLMASHLQAHHQQNPKALHTISRELQLHAFWGPALLAMQEAQRIYRNRRASGGSSMLTLQRKEFEADFRANTPWYVSYLDARQPEHSVPLTPREQEIAVFVSEGLSNPQIAALLHCSVRTVESHIANARAKLGAPTRAALGRRFSSATAEA